MTRRIVSLLSSGTEILCGIGVGHQLVAVSHECDYPPEVMGLPRVTSTDVDGEAGSAAIDAHVRDAISTGQPLFRMDRARISDLAPHVIVTQSQCSVCAVSHREVLDWVRAEPSLASTDVIDLNPLTCAEVLQDIRRLGAALDVAHEADRFYQTLCDRLDRIGTVTAGLSPQQRPNVACVEWIEPLMLAAHWMPDLVRRAGGQQNFTTGGQPSRYSAWDEVRRQNPDFLLIMPCGFGLERALREARLMRDWPGWHELTAVQAGQVYAVDANSYFNRSGPRLVDSVEILAHLLHPSRFTAPSLSAAWRPVPLL